MAALNDMSEALSAAQVEVTGCGAFPWPRPGALVEAKFPFGLHAPVNLPGRPLPCVVLGIAPARQVISASSEAQDEQAALVMPILRVPATGWTVPTLGNLLDPRGAPKKGGAQIVVNRAIHLPLARAFFPSGLASQGSVRARAFRQVLRVHEGCEGINDSRPVHTPDSLAAFYARQVGALLPCRAEPAAPAAHEGLLLGLGRDFGVNAECAVMCLKADGGFRYAALPMTQEYLPTLFRSRARADARHVADHRSWLDGNPQAIDRSAVSGLIAAPANAGGSANLSL